MISLTKPEVEGLTSKLASLSAREELSKEQVAKLVFTLELSEREGDHVLVLECIRALRNAVAGVSRNQQWLEEMLISSSTFHFWEFCERLTKQTPAGDDTAPNRLRCCVQLIGNLTAGNNSLQVRHHQCIISVLQSCLCSCDYKAKMYACMPLLSLIQSWSCLPSSSLPQVASFLPLLLPLLNLEENSQTPASDFLHLCLQELMSSKTFLPFLSPKERALIIPFLMSEGDNRLNIDLHENSVDLLAHDFTLATDGLLTTTLTSMDQLAPSSVLELAQVLALAAGQEEYKKVLQSYKSLLINTVYLLKMVHTASRNGVAGLCLLGKISDLNIAGDDLHNSPSYGFMVALIRLLTNLVWGHSSNKSLVGELEGIALVLDCSQIDARNPFITQWVVLAIRGLTENHPRNQAVLAGLRKEGMVDSDLMKELGVDVRQQ